MTSKAPQNNSSFKNLSGKKLLLYTTILVCIFTATAVSIIQLSNIVIGGSSYKTIKSSSEALENIAQINSNLHQIINEVRPIMHDADKGAAITMARLIAIDTDKRFVALQELVTAPGRREAVIKADGIWKEYKKTLLEEIVPAAGKGDKLKIAYLTTGIQDQRYSSLNKVMSSLAASLRLDIAGLEQRAAADMTIKIAAMALLTCIALGLIVYFSQILFSSFNRSLQPSTNRIKEISDDKLDNLLPDDGTVKSGELTESSSQMNARFHQTITNVAAISDELDVIGNRLIKTASGAFSCATASGQAISTLTGSSEKIINAAETITGSLMVLSDSAEKNSADVEQLAAHCREICTRSEQLGDRVRHIAKTASEINSSSDRLHAALSDLQLTADAASASTLQLDSAIRRAETIARNTFSITEALQQDVEIGREAAEGSIGGVRAIRMSSRQTTEAVESLSRRAGEIDGLVSGIDELAEQTNLLALNANIIASQAGEHGKGFAVIADEIRELSVRTGSSSREISAAIRGIHLDARRAADSLVQVEADLVDGEQLSQRSLLALNLVVSGIQQACIQFRDIVDVTTGQTMSSLAVKESIDNLSKLLEQTAMPSGGQPLASSYLGSLAAELNGAVAELCSLTQKLDSCTRATALSAEISQAAEQIVQAAVPLKENCSAIIACAQEINSATAPAVTDAAAMENDINELNRQIELLKGELSTCKH